MYAYYTTLWLFVQRSILTFLESHHFFLNRAKSNTFWRHINVGPIVRSTYNSPQSVIRSTSWTSTGHPVNILNLNRSSGQHLKPQSVIQSSGQHLSRSSGHPKCWPVNILGALITNPATKEGDENESAKQRVCTKLFLQKCSNLSVFEKKYMYVSSFFSNDNQG